LVPCENAPQQGSQNYPALKSTPTNPHQSHYIIMHLAGNRILLFVPAFNFIPSSTLFSSPIFLFLSMHRIPIRRFGNMATKQNFSLKSTINLNNGVEMPRIQLGVYMFVSRLPFRFQLPPSPLPKTTENEGGEVLMNFFGQDLGKGMFKRSNPRPRSRLPRNRLRRMVRQRTRSRVLYPLLLILLPQLPPSPKKRCMAHHKVEDE
jgi:hypothetical protein